MTLCLGTPFASPPCCGPSQIPDAPAIGTWTAGDVANHITWGIENYTKWLEDKAAPDLDAIENMSQWNVDAVSQMPTAHLSQLVERIDVATERFIQTAEENSRPQGSAGTLETESRSRSQLPCGSSKRSFTALTSRTPQEGNGRSTRDPTTYSMYNYVVQDNELTVQTSERRADWHFSVDPFSWVLVTTERHNQWLAAVTGKILSWGRRASLPFKLRAASFQG